MSKRLPERPLGKRPPGRPLVLKNKVYINFWAEEELLDMAKGFAAKYSVTRSEILRTLMELGLKDIDAEMMRRTQDAE